MSQTTLDVAYGILLANIIPLGIVGAVFVVYVLSVLALNTFDDLKHTFFRKNK